MDTQTNNKLIADFMGHQVNFGFKRNGVLFHGEHINIDKLLYHNSWDWLMSVVEKIYSLDEYYRYKMELSIFELELKELFPDIEKVYEFCSNFIKWYKQNKTL